ncbi:hypothetical protein BKI52_35745 [marine bacterium AO1-C]|nr:hypothetical protein BKI52_35745 [marine bacterium AO1-C]
MKKIPPQESDLFFEGKNTQLYLLPQEKGTPTVLVKVIHNELTKPNKLIELKNEYYFTHGLAIKGVRKALKLDTLNNLSALYLEYVEGETLKTFIRHPFFDLHYFIEIAINITQTLEEIHQHNIIHKNLNSHHIIVNSQTRQVKLIDFGIASQFSVKAQYLENAIKLEGHHAYISPEQTGRMNRKIEYRTDIYSLGVVFYEMLSQQLPFTHEDTLELIHAHLAKTPPPLHAIENPRFTIPKALSLMVNKMMAKNAENRYQSAFGIRRDLEKIRKNLENKIFTIIEIGAEDISGKFQIPEKLYGREDELNILDNLLKNIHQSRTELVLVAGEPGVGKSSLIAELYKSVDSKQAFFVEGKFDQLENNIPYFAWVEAIQQFVHLLLTKSKESLQIWKRKLNQALAPIGKVLTDLIPSLELIIGEQPKVPELEPSETQNRFEYVLKLFIKTITSNNQPLILFIDDWQWADKASVDLLFLLLEDPTIHHLAIIAAYRDHSVAESHPFAQALKKLSNHSLHYKKHKIQLNPLSPSQVEEIITDTIQQKSQQVKLLAALVHAKTAGNAFFVIQFLQALHTQESIKFNHHNNSWVWDIHKIQHQNITDNVVQLMADKIYNLPKPTQEVLKVLASIGNQADLFIIAEVCKKEVPEVFNNLLVALKEELIIYIGDVRHLSLLSQNQQLNAVELQNLSLDFKFAHDSIQQAAYASIAKDKKAHLHLEIGRSLYKKHEANLADYLFQVTNQYNQGSSLVQDTQEKYLMARLNLLSGQKARNAVAFTLASKYTHLGLSLLSDQAWEEQYPLMLQLHNLAFETDYLVGNYEKTDHWMQIILQKTHHLTDQIPAYKIKINALKARNQLLEAVETAEDLIHKLGIKIPKNPKQFHIIKHMVSLSIFFRGKKIEQFAQRPRIPHNQMDTVSEIVETMGRAVFFAKPNLLPILVAITNKSAYKYNHPLYAPVAYSAYGLILCGVTGDIDPGYKFGQVAQRLVDEIDSKHTRAITLFNIHVLINHWKEPLANSLPYLDEIYTLCREVGNNEYAGFAISLKVIHSIYLGKNLQDLTAYLLDVSEVVSGLNQRSVEKGFGAIYQFVLQLTQPSPTPQRLLGARFTLDKDLPELIAAKDNAMIFSIYVMQAKLAYIFEDFKLAYDTILKGQRFIEGGTGVESLPVYYLYYALSMLAFLEHLTPRDQKRALKEIRKIIKKYEKYSLHAPMNYKHRLLLIKAELAKVQGKLTTAKSLYDKAIHYAHLHRFVSDEAIAWEAAARYYQQLEQTQLYELHLSQAFKVYQAWGAIEKVHWFEQKYPHLFSSKGPANYSHSSQQLDLKSIIKGSQILSGEIQLEKLLRKMMNIVIENAGAQRGVLLLNKKNQLLIEAEVDISLEVADFLKSISLEEALGTPDVPKISSEIVYYVARTQKSLVLQDAVNQGDFTHVPYIKQFKPKSILCTPLLHQGNLSGVLYLENPMVKGVFTAERIETLHLLSSQVAISIENAKLYENLEENVIERTIELAFANKELNTNIETIRQQKEEITQQAEELKTSNEKLEELSNFKESLSHMLIHDAKQPLSPLVNSSDKKVRKAANQVLNMLENILEVQKFESNENIITLENILMGDLMATAIHQVRDLADDKLITIKNSIPLDLTIKADLGYITRVLSNLLGNAIKYIPTNSIVRIEAETLLNSNFLKIWIKDNGPGIPDAHKTSIFEKFGRIDKKDQRSTGLGLAFCKLAIEAHGGRIGVLTTSETQALNTKGAWFYFTIPLVNNESGNAPQTPPDPEASITQEFTVQDRKLIQAFIPQLKRISYYDAGKIMILLQDRDWAGSPALEAWIDRIPFTDNEEHYQKMLAVFGEV